MQLRPFVFLGLANIALILPSSQASAVTPVTTSTYAVVRVLGFNCTAQNSTCYGSDYVTGPYQFGDALAQAAFSGSTTANGLNGNSESDTTSITYSAMAEASLAGGLKAQSSISVTNLFFNTDNTPYTNTNLTSNVGGVPETYETEADAVLHDAIAVSGADSLSRVKFVFDIDGTLTTDSSFLSSASVNLYNPTSASTAFQNIYAASAGAASNTINTTATSDYYNVVDGLVYLDLWFTASADVGNGFNVANADFGDASSSADFFHTIKIAQVIGYDAQGNQVNLNSAVGGDGTRLAALSNAVPEPASWALMLGGFGLIGGALRRRSAVIRFA